MVWGKEGLGRGAPEEGRSMAERSEPKQLSRAIGKFYWGLSLEFLHIKNPRRPQAIQVRTHLLEKRHGPD